MMPDHAARPTCAVVTAETRYEGRQKAQMIAGISHESVGAQGLCMHLVTIEPGKRGAVHLHENHETALYVMKGVARTWFGEGLESHVDTAAGDMLYIPAGVPHVPANLSFHEHVRAVLARTDPNEQESVVMLDALEERACQVVGEALAARGALPQ